VGEGEGRKEGRLERAGRAIEAKKVLSKDININANRRSATMQHSQLSDVRDRFDRRAFCKAAGRATAVGVIEASLGSVLANADLTKEQRDKMTDPAFPPANWWSGVSVHVISLITSTIASTPDAAMMASF
jgi:hypothetical protein